ncbi:MAG: hypothetical protein A2255_06280 [Candidatus Melainabacteria bacterium RIFOXYA2_FULL_32_9]|nr:MAG: hypothetical protein A2255_06280 [Candidatus Melainabacteria bacterium RIFOXYA2_FULL_32_9]
MDNQEFNTINENTFEESSQDFFSSENQELQFEDENSSHQVPLAALIEERKKFQKQIEEEKTLRQQYENVLTALGQDSSSKTDPVSSLKFQYENILKTQGEAAANIWLNQQMVNQSFAVQSENQSVLSEVQDKYRDIYAVPEVKQAIDAYLKMDMDPTRSLKEQGFTDAVEYISSIYKAGYESGMRLKSQNDTAKSRMGSSVTSGIPSISSGKVFSRAEIASMNAETFSKYEKVIFDQMAKGLIK